MGLTSRRYSIYKIAGRKVTNELKRPGVAQDGQAPIWDNALKKYKPGAAGGGGSSYSIAEVSIDGSGDIELDMNNLSVVTFFTDAVINELSFWNLLNAANGKEFNCIFEIGINLDEQNFPDDWLVSTLTGEWDGDKWIPGNPGKYLMKGISDGTSWHVQISGTFTNV
jgi:hypothetical protein